MDLKVTYNRIAEDWFKDHNTDTWWQSGTDRFLSLLAQGASVLDVGCGAGQKSKYISSRGFKVTGVDLSDKMIEISKREVPEADFFVKNIYDLDSIENKFDAVFAQAVLLHIPRERVLEVLEKFKNKLNSSGLLYLAVKEVKPDGPNQEVLKENDYGYDYERFFSYFTLEEIKEYLSKTGFKVLWETIDKSGSTNWIQVIARLEK
jgi:SAM-dependent methyltransferase